MQDGGATVVIILGQGTMELKDGHWVHYSEYPADTKVYLDYMGWIGERIDDIKPELVVISGGYTRPETPDMSEAHSMLEFFRSSRWPKHSPVVLDDISLDTAENAIFSCMTARMAMDGVLTPVLPGTNDDRQILAATASSVKNGHGAPTLKPGATISQIIILLVWRFKALRLSLLATSLGLPRFAIRGFAEAGAANAAEAACLGEAKGIVQIMTSRDVLQTGSLFETKRRARFIRGEALYAKRLEGLRQLFPGSFKQLDEFSKLSQYEIDQFRRAFQQEVFSQASKVPHLPSPSDLG